MGSNEKLSCENIIKFPCIAKLKDAELFVLFVAKTVGTILVGQNGRDKKNEMGLCFKTFVQVSDQEFWEIIKVPITFTFKSSQVFMGEDFPRTKDGKQADFACVARNKKNNEIALIPDIMRGTIIGNCVDKRIGSYFGTPDFEHWQILDEITITFNL